MQRSMGSTWSQCSYEQTPRGAKCETGLILRTGFWFLRQEIVIQKAGFCNQGNFSLF